VTSVQQRGSATDLATAHGQEAKRRGPSASLAADPALTDVGVAISGDVYVVTLGSE
jgi:hypothetical protein